MLHALVGLGTPASGPPPMLGEHETVVFAAYDVVNGTGEDGG